MKKMLTAILMALFIGATANAYAATTLFTETFDAGLGAWTVNNDNYDDYTWEHNLNSTWNYTGGTGGFAMADCYSSWANDWYDSIVSPVIDVTGMDTLTVSANISYQHDTEDGYADITYSVDGGSTWLALAEYTATFQGAVSFDITLAPGTTDFQLSFEYYLPAWSYYEYQVDNVMVEGATASVPVPGAFLLLTTGLAALAAYRRQ